MSVIPDSDHGARVRDRLAHETVVWFATVAADGTPEKAAVRPRVSLDVETDESGVGGS